MYPNAYISTRKNRTKTYTQHQYKHLIGNGGKVVFLQDGANFEVELDNPSSKIFLAKIKLNGEWISSSGIVLRPGEHIFLDRYLDQNAKFVFNTYEISKSREHLTEKNGLVEIVFYRESTVKPIITWPLYPRHSISFEPYYDTFTTNTDGVGSSGMFSSTGTSTFVACSTNDSFSPEEGVNDVETGRVEAGKQSQQTFSSVSTEFESGIACSRKYKILPVSQKPVTINEVRIYCTGCGSKLKKAWKHCAQCGHRV